MHAVGASSNIDVPTSLTAATGSTAAVSTATRIAEARLDELLTTYGKLPVLEVSIGYRF